MRHSDSKSFTDSILGRIGSWLPRGWIWRVSSLGPLQTLLSVMHMTAFGRKGYRAALREVFDRMHEAFGWSGDAPTPSALTQARGKLSEKMCRDLFRRLSDEATAVSSHARLRYRDFARVVAVDGTKVPLASTPALKRDFGCPQGEHLAPQALLSVLWNIGGNVPVDWRLGRCDGSEQADLESMLGSLGDGDLLLADRLYPSRALMAELHRRKIHFVFRIKVEGPRSMREIREFQQSNATDLTTEMIDHPGIPMRLVRGYREGSEHMVFVTSLPADDHSAQAVADLYQRRWAIETAYREGKTWHGLGDLPGRSKQHIRQEVCALMIHWLMQGELEGQARAAYAEEIRKQPTTPTAWTPAEGITEIPVRFNRALAATSIALLMAAAVTSQDAAIESWRVSIRYLWKNRSRIKPGRSYRRTSQRPHILRKRDEMSRAQVKGGRKKARPCDC